ncbi:phage head-tail joining protein [Citreimonas sp.]|uniref:phage head-tail joining protein n=1 Tax=Citreimonas sp. TaxID=3036715 RepID=UPI004059DE12
MSYTEADLARVDQAISSGASEVEYSDGRRVRYRSVADLRAIRHIIAMNLAAQAGTRTPRFVNPTFDRGV